MGTQTRLPGTLPTPEGARRKLQDALLDERTTSLAVASFHEHLAAARIEVDGAAGTLQEVERQMLAAAAGSNELAAADAEQQKTWKRLLRAEAGMENLRLTLRAAKLEAKRARGQVRAAREDLEALRQGRRKAN